jgi:hypothetical protein
MGKLGMNFRRWPHTCEIYATVGAGSFADGQKETVWKGVCRKELTGRGQGHEYVLRSDYRINLGEIVDGKEVGAHVEGITAGMYIEVTDSQGTAVLVIKDAYCGNLGTSVFADRHFT